MLCLKLLCSLLLLGLAVAAPQDLDNGRAAADPARHRVERNRRQLLGEQEDEKLDLEHDKHLSLLETSLEMNDRVGDNEVNGTKSVDDKKIEYYHEKNKGTIKTIVEEKAQDENKLENVFYHLSYEKETSSTPEPTAEDTTLPEETTDQTLPDDEEETVAPLDNEYLNLNNANNNLDDATIPSSEDTPAPESAEPNPNNLQPAAGPGWFNNWFNWVGQTLSAAGVTQPTPSASPSDLPDTPQLDRAIGTQYEQFTILSPFYFGSIGLKSPECPPHRSTQISIYFFSFCI